MFLIASTGRTGTLALTRGLDAFSDHEVAHEPDPLLREAWLKHRGLPYDSGRLRERVALYAGRHAAADPYGESVRTPNLLMDFLAAAPGAPLLVIVRDPVGYVRSAHRRQVLRKGDEWDRYRLMPEDDGPGAPRAPVSPTIGARSTAICSRRSRDTSRPPCCSTSRSCPWSSGWRAFSASP